MNSLLNSPARWTTIRAAGLAIVAAAIVLPAANAEATCMVDSADAVRYCTPSSSVNAVTISIGSDSFGQWIVYQDAVTGLCTYDMIGTSIFSNDTHVTGTSHSDTIRTIASSGTVICGFSFNPPSPGSRELTLDSGGGYDYMVSHLGSTVTLSCAGYNEGCYLETWGPGAVVGSEANDQVMKNGSGDWWFATRGGDDMIWNYGSGTVIWSFCGTGTDYYYGTWDTETRDCEVR